MRYEIRKINKEKEARWAAPPHFGPLPVPRLQPSLLHLAPTRGPARQPLRALMPMEPGAPTDGPPKSVSVDIAT
jgi:hypothetical protein